MPRPYNKDHKERARDLRAHMTDAERHLWRHLRRKQILGLQFYRQKPIHQYIVDFYCPRAHLVIEVDGGQHFQPDHAEQDRERDAVLEQLGLETLRFSNRDILQHLDQVLATIHQVARQRLGQPPGTQSSGRSTAPPSDWPRPSKEARIRLPPLKKGGWGGFFAPRRGTIQLVSTPPLALTVKREHRLR